MLERVRIPSPQQRVDEYPHKLSGGMRQRVMIAMALACAPALLIADEPTTALDVTIQAQILDLLAKLRAETGAAIILITHDLGVVAETCDDVAVMYAGEIVEQAPAAQLFSAPQHPYTVGLLGSIPLHQRTARAPRHHLRQRAEPRRRASPAAASPAAAPSPTRAAAARPAAARRPPLALLEPLERWCMIMRAAGHAPLESAGWRLECGAAASTPQREHERPARTARRLRGAPLAARRADGRWCAPSTASRSRSAAGETLALVGESGCGKSTVGRLALRLIEPTAGSVRFDGRDLASLSGAELRRARAGAQLIFQDPYGSLNPRMTVGEMLAEPLLLHTDLSPASRRERVAELLRMVGLRAEHAQRYPHEFSGGQRQRIAIARALAVEPKLIVCDEPVSALDVSIRSQILNLLKDLQQRLGLAYIFISHDLAVVKHIAARVAVMYLGRIVESAASEADLRRAAPSLHAGAAVRRAGAVDGERRPRRILPGDPPSPLEPPPGCHLHPRCAHAQDICRRARPELAIARRCARHGLPSVARHSFLSPARIRRGTGILGEPAASISGVRCQGGQD